jgi:endo-beta-N-acetylglucosaminidase D
VIFTRLLRASPRVARCFRTSAAFALSLIVFLSITNANAAPKTFRYFRFVPTKTRDNPAVANSIQIAELQFLRHHSPISVAGVSVTNPGGNNPVGETPSNLLDGNLSTKWLDFNKSGLRFTFPAPVTIDAYRFATANDAEERDPSNWKFEGSPDGTVWTLLDDIDSYSATTARGTWQAEFNLPATVPPYSSSWHPDYFLKWTPAADPNAAFNRSTVPLATRFAPSAASTPLNTAFNVNTHARPGEARIVNSSGFPTSGNPSQSSLIEHSNAISYWQYTEHFVYFGGSASEGLILAPNAAVVDAAHRNGVPVYGNIFFPPTAFGGRFQWVTDFLEKNGSVFPVADKLIEVANYYGFDGWFINQETAGGTSSTATTMKDFIRYFRAQAPNLKIMWYDAMNESGAVGWQDRFNTSNDLFMKDGTNPVSHSMFIDFGWSSSGITASRTLAESLGLDPYDLYAGIEFDSNAFNQPFDWTWLFPEGSAHKISAGIFGYNRNFKNAGSATSYHANELRFWSGPNGDPTNTVTADTWKGIAHYVPASSPLTALPFATNFNLGHGHLYAINGQIRSTREWSNLSLQDVLPTWRWIVQSSSTNKLTPTLDLSTAYYGGTNLRINGTLDATNDIKLYQCSLTVAADTSLRIVFNREATGASAMQVGLAFEDAPATFQYLDVGNAATSSWNTKTFSLSTYAGRKIAVITLRFISGSPISNYLMRVGQLAVYNSSITGPAAPTNLEIIQQDNIDVDTLALRLKWSPSPGAVCYYNVYSRTPSNSLVWLGATPNNTFFVPAARRQAQETTMPIEVEAIGTSFETSTRINADATFPPGPNTNYQLTGTVIGSPGAWNNGTNTREKAFDGSLSTFYDALNPTGDWTGLDLGSGNARVITGIRYCPRTNFAARMVGGLFQGANTADFSDSVTLATVTLVPVASMFTTFAVDEPTAFRYLRYIGPDNSNCNVAEVQFFGISLPPAPSNLAGQMVEGATSIAWDSAAFAASYNVKRSTAFDGPYTTIATNRIPVNYTDTGLNLGATYYYAVSAVNELGEGPDSTPIQVSDTYYAWVQLNGIAPGSSGSAFNADFDGDGVKNGSEYMSPKGLNVTQSASVRTVLAEVRIDPAITVLLQSSLDLVTWNPLSFTVATDQSNVPPGFHRMIFQESVGPGVTTKFYRMRFTR